MPVEQNEFSALYEEHYTRIAGYLKRIVGELEAEDAAQRGLAES